MTTYDGRAAAAVRAAVVRSRKEAQARWRQTPVGMVMSALRDAERKRSRRGGWLASWRIKPLRDGSSTPDSVPRWSGV